MQKCKLTDKTAYHQDLDKETVPGHRLEQDKIRLQITGAFQFRRDASS